MRLPPPVTKTVFVAGVCVIQAHFIENTGEGQCGPETPT
jgi:hypothetical protein